MIMTSVSYLYPQKRAKPAAAEMRNLVLFEVDEESLQA